MNQEYINQKQVEQGLSRKQQMKRRNATAVWLGCLMGLICGILMVIVAVKLYTNEMQRLEWSSQAVESRQTSVHLYEEAQKTGTQIQMPGGIK